MKIKYTMFKKNHKRNDTGVVEKTLTYLGEIIVDEKGDVLFVSSTLVSYDNEKLPLNEILRRWGNGAYYECHSNPFIG